MEGKTLTTEKMKKRLEELGVDNIDTCSPKEMREILSVMDASMEMTNRIENNTRNQKKDSLSSNNFIRDVDTKGDTDTENERPKPSWSHNTRRNSNSELPNVGDNSDDDVSDDITDKYLQKCSNQKSNKNTKSKLNRWRLNPLDSHTDQNDVPLQQPTRPLAQERIPFRLCKDAHTIEKGNKVMGELSVHLKEMADLWLSGHGSTQLKFQWGTPIQVDIPNNSFDRKPVMVVSNSNEVGDVNTNYNRTSKRKATWLTSAASLSSSSDDSDEINFSFLKRKKSESANKAKSLHNTEQVTEDTNHLKQNNDTKVVDNKKINSKNVNVKTQQELNERVVSPEMLSNSRRITPSKTNTLDKKRAQSPLSVQDIKGSNRKDSGRSPVTSRRESINNKVTIEDITKEFEIDSDENNETMLTEDVVIKPIPMKNFSPRLAKQCALLRQVDAERKKKIMAEQMEAQKKEEEEKEKRKQDFISRRMKEMEKTFKQEEEQRKKEKEKDKWLEVLQSRNKNRMQKWKEQEKIEIEKQQKQVFLQDNDNVQMTEEMIEVNNCLEKKVTCPICNKSFPSDKIENHAAMCEQFETDSEHEQDNIYSPQSSKYVVKEKTKKSDTIYECNICSSFKTNNGIDYEDHVNSCIQHKQNSKPQGYTPITITIPDSPVRSYQPISEQRNSNIDYSGQLSSVSKAQVGRKRKR